VKPSHTSIFIISIIVMTTLSGRRSEADLTSPIYQSAKTLYNKNNCNDAKDGLNKYKVSDQEWLTAHPDIQAKIDAAIAYCTPTPGSSVAVGPQIRVVPKPPPPLP
jgi:hypothetical protein